MLHMATNVAVLVPGGACDQRIRACANVRLLLILRSRDASQMEEAAHGVSNIAVYV